MNLVLCVNLEITVAFMAMATPVLILGAEAGATGSEESLSSVTSGRARQARSPIENADTMPIYITLNTSCPNKDYPEGVLSY